MENPYSTNRNDFAGHFSYMQSCESHEVWNKAIAARDKWWIEEMEQSCSATNYHSPEAGKGLVNSIDVEIWQQIKKEATE